MKTIVELNDSLLEKIKRHAARHHTALRAVLERALDHFPQRWTTTPFRMRRATCSGNGPQAGIQEENWNPIRSRIHEGKADNRGRYRFG
ncbi:MAG: hypothetical protein R3F36_05695 [Candidatus Competibacteraceae bacterium]